jgi:hypothetical protein
VGSHEETAGRVTDHADTPGGAAVVSPPRITVGRSVNQNNSDFDRGLFTISMGFGAFWSLPSLVMREGAHDALRIGVTSSRRQTRMPGHFAVVRAWRSNRAGAQPHTKARVSDYYTKDQ